MTKAISVFIIVLGLVPLRARAEDSPKDDAHQIGQDFKRLGQSIGKGAEDVGKAIGKKGKEVGGKVADETKEIRSEAKEAGQDVGEKSVSVFESAGNAVKRMWRKVTGDNGGSDGKTDEKTAD
jgi:hypothetical protein